MNELKANLMLKNSLQNSVLQIRDFQLVGQWAEGLRPQLVQESCILLLPRSTKNGESQCWFILYHVYKVFSWEIIVLNWIDIMNIIFKKRIIRRSYPNIHLHINYVRSFQEICIYFDRPKYPNGRQWPMTGHYFERWMFSMSL